MIYHYDHATGEVVEGPAEKRGTSLPVPKFTPFRTYQYTKDAARDIGAPRDKEGCTYVETQAQVNKYIAREADRGREVHWRQH